MINDSSKISSSLKEKNHKVTPIRKKILEIFFSSESPISAIDLIESFKDAKQKVNKTTIYRELEFLINKEFIKEIEFGEGKKRYELESENHHHHIICLNCKKVEDVELNPDLSSEEKRLEKKTGFKINSHSLEFFGYCKNCRKLFSV